MTELMVAMVIGLIGTLIIFNAFTNSSAISENINSVSDATQNGSIGLFTIEQDVRNSGYGLNTDELLGCLVNAHNRTFPSGQQDFSFTLSPVNITKGATAADSDSIRVAYSRVSSIVPVKTTGAHDGSTAALALSSRYGFEPGNIILLAESGKPCTMRQISTIATTVGDNTISHDGPTFTDVYGNSHSVIHNRTGGGGTTYSVGSSVYNLGTTPVSNEYTVVDNNLVVRNPLLGTADQVVVPDIIQMKANYGMVDNTGVVTFSDDTPDNLVEWKSVTSIRVALVARSRAPDYTQGSGTSCTTTTAGLPWAGGTLDISETSDDWRCYRYRVFETTILLRNMIWTPA